MGTRSWRQIGLALVLLAIAAALLLSERLVTHVAWHGTPIWQSAYELIAAAIAIEVAAFALSRFGLERRRLPLFVGLAYLGGGVADLVASLVAQGNYLMPQVRQAEAVAAVWTAGRLWLATCLLVGLAVQRRAPTAPSARIELLPLTLIGACGAFALAQLSQMITLPGLLHETAPGIVARPWDAAIGGLLVVALPGYWSLYRRQGGSMIGSVLVSLVIGLFAQGYGAQSRALYDTQWNLATVLKIVSYLPLLVGLFVESVTLFRAQTKLTGELQVAQAELSEYSRELENKVADRTRALETRAKDLEAFAYTVSHDLKAPLRGVHTYVHLLVEECGDKLSEAGRRYASSVDRAASQMRSLIDDLLEYSRLERREVEPAPVNLRELIESILTDRQPQIDQTGTKIELDLALSTVTGDRAMLHAALGNLIDNAIKFSRQSQPPHVVVRSRDDDGACIINVQDNGVGFDMKDARRVFEIFQRLRRADEFEGTGIGLSIVKRAVEKHGGRITAQSEPGRGATFTIRIPNKHA